ncbi:hypothetical protein BJ165DRAFT_1608530 [Panaeolus papilionaceus]|nr:hypothetical protein BJ165DRAFT_1608530 [Panaeolus papilionaceus]
MRLQGYPSSASRKGLPSSQSASLFRSIANALANVLELPPEKRDANSTYTFLATYANHTATEVLDGWIWPEHKGVLKLEKASNNAVLVRKRVLLLAEKVAMSKIQGGGGLDLQTLLDLSVVYSRTSPSKLRDVFKAVAASPFSTSLVSDITRELVPGFIRLLHSPPSHAQGLYAQRKVAECITAFLRGAKNCPEFIRPFFDNDSEDPSSSFLLAVAQSYEDGLTRMATAYGGLGQLNQRIASIDPRNLTSPSRNDDDADDWQRIWIETKVTLLDAFHIVFSTMLDDLAAASAGIQLAFKGEKAFALIFKLLEGGGSSSSRPSAGPGGSSSIPPTPYLNRSLLTDYNNAHPVEKTLSRVLQKADERDVRLDLLESSLADLNTDDRGNGALKLLLHSAGLPLGIGNNSAHTSSQPPAAESASGTRKDNGIPTPSPPKTTLSAEEELEITLKGSQILDILPDTPNALIRKLLLSQKYGGDPEQVLGALLEGAEGVGIGVDAEPVPVQPKAVLVPPVSDYDLSQRRNVFDDEELDASKIRVGKRAESPSLNPLADRSFMEQMKADILRRAEAISDSEDESELGDPFAEYKEEKHKQAKGKQKTDNGLIDDEDDLLTEAAHFHVRDAGGEDDSADEDLSADDEDEGEGVDAPVTPEIMIELAYIEDAAVFQRDANTRRSKARKELKDKTGWDDGQIEGWAVMLERDPARKQKVIDRHTGSLSFRGNVKGMKVREASGSGHRGRGRGGGRGRGRGGGGSGGRGGGGGGGGDANSARERAWKDKNKASRANHNRKRGHDKKMAKAGAGIPPGG